MFAFWKKRNRRQVRNSGPTLLERLNWRAIGGAAAAVAGAAVLALLLVVALDRPVRHIVLEGDFQRVSPPEIESTIAGTVHGGLASVDLEAVQERIERIEWVDRAVVRRMRHVHIEGARWAGVPSNCLSGARPRRWLLQPDSCWAPRPGCGGTCWRRRSGCRSPAPAPRG